MADITAHVSTVTVAAADALSPVQLQSRPAELRLGTKPQQVVRISRTDGTPRRTALFPRTDR